MSRVQLLATAADDTVVGCTRAADGAAVVAARRCGMYLLLSVGWACQGHTGKLATTAVHLSDAANLDYDEPQAMLDTIIESADHLAKCAVPNVVEAAGPHAVTQIETDLRLVAQQLKE